MRAFYGRRKGHKLRRGQASLIATVLPKFALDLTRPAPADLRTLFKVPAGEVQLEIGFGGGEHLIHEAASRPGSGLLGCEPYVNGMAKALGLIEAAGLKNIRLYHGDALELLDWLPPRSLGRIDLLYPDPWPKKRHWKRRFVSDEMIGRIARVVRPDGSLRFATDWPDYAEWTLQHFLRAPAFAWTAERADDWRQPWAGFPGTRYEKKAHAQGLKPVYLEFRRV
ncbi:MAG TPA: tRNA (guanosine(46)-N7)-methyltransferase TrmB [Xanthobacteraceae bacterium]|nr:tRNA (guanosine(46)-N7)-methyltransferase TrmB [Xanthobacteraceae bacterium]